MADVAQIKADVAVVADKVDQVLAALANIPVPVATQQDLDDIDAAVQAVNAKFG